MKATQICDTRGLNMHSLQIPFMQRPGIQFLLDKLIPWQFHCPWLRSTIFPWRFSCSYSRMRVYREKNHNYSFPMQGKAIHVYRCALHILGKENWTREQFFFFRSWHKQFFNKASCGGIIVNYLLGHSLTRKTCVRENMPKKNERGALTQFYYI